MSFFSPFVLVLALSARTLKKTWTGLVLVGWNMQDIYVKYLYRIR